MALQDNVNKAPADGAAAMYWWIATNLLCGWEGVSRGEGTGSGTGRLTTFGPGDFTATSLQGLNAWAIFKRTGTNHAVRVRRSADVADWSKWSVAHAASGYDATGTEDTPDAENVPGDSQDVHATLGGEAQLFPADGSYRCSSVGEDASAFGAYLLANLSGVGTFYTILHLEFPTCFVGDNAPYVAWANYSAGGVQLTYAVASGFASAPKAWTAYGIGGQAAINTPVGFFTTSYGGAVYSNQPVDPYTSSSFFNLVPFWGFNAGTGAPTGLKGVSKLLSAKACTGIANGSMDDDAATGFRWVAVNDIYLRWPTDPAKAMVL